MDDTTTSQQMIEAHAEFFIQYEAAKWFPMHESPESVIEQLRDYADQLNELADNCETELPTEAE